MSGTPAHYFYVKFTVIGFLFSFFTKFRIIERKRTYQGIFDWFKFPQKLNVKLY